MNSRLRYILLLLVVSAALSAETINLRLSTGQIITGEVVFENEEVVIVRTADGARYQYPKTDVQLIDDAEAQLNNEQTETETTHRQKVGVQIHVGGGAAMLPRKAWGGNANAKLAIGAVNMFDRRIFLGGSVAVNVNMLMSQAFTFIPLCLEAQIPLVNADIAPYIGMSIGYGFAANKQAKGGMAAAVDLGYRFQTRGKAVVLLALNVNLQQARLTVTENYEGNTYDYYSGRLLLSLGAKLAVQL